MKKQYKKGDFSKRVKKRVCKECKECRWYHHPLSYCEGDKEICKRFEFPEYP